MNALRSWLIAVALGVATAAWLQAADSRPNVLFIVADDLNHWVGHLGRNPQAKTPHLDRLAAMGVSFTAANCPAPACNPSRAAVLSGRRPSTTGIYDNGQEWSSLIPSDQVLTVQFMRAGYRVIGAGKIFHGSAYRSGEWTEHFPRDRGAPLKLHASAKPDAGQPIFRFGPLDNSDADMADYRSVSYGVEQLRANHEKPFFLAIGLEKPHMPFSVPKHWFDLFPLATIQLPPHEIGDLDDVPVAGRALTKYIDDHAAILKAGRWKEAVQAYLATIAFADAQVGRLLDALEASPYRDNTIVCFWGDHGWHLGEKSRWRKFTLWEESARTPFIWKVPGLTSAGRMCARPVELMSIYATLCDLASIPRPAHVEGHSLRSLLKDPDAAWAHAALTTYKRGNHSVRSQEWRYIRYADGGEELYRHIDDPYEWNNLADDPRHSDMKHTLAAFMPKVNAASSPQTKDDDR